MFDAFYNQFALFKDYPVTTGIISFVLLLVAAYIIKLVAQTVFSGIFHLFHQRFFKGSESLLAKYRIFTSFANYIAILLVHYGLYFLPYCPEPVLHFVQLVCRALAILVTSVIIVKFLKIFNDVYSEKKDRERASLKSFVQLLQILIYIICGLLILGVFLNKDIFHLLAGLGALTAVFMLVFQNTILSFVASIQVSTYDMVRIGDWIEMPSFNADGDVIDISLHTITVQNLDKTITIIPTNRIVTDNFRNWRGMVESGVRRIKRAILVDQTTVHFLTPEELKHLQAMPHVAKHLDASSLKSSSDPIATEVQDGLVTNLGLLRAYMLAYIKSHPGINPNMMTLARYLDPTNAGIPFEIYCFTKKTDTVFYEAVQSGIFDHLLAILPEFGLKVGQTRYSS